MTEVLGTLARRSCRTTVASERLTVADSRMSMLIDKVDHRRATSGVSANMSQQIREERG